MQRAKAKRADHRGDDKPKHEPTDRDDRWNAPRPSGCSPGRAWAANAGSKPRSASMLASPMPASPMPDRTSLPKLASGIKASFMPASGGAQPVPRGAFRKAARRSRRLSPAAPQAACQPSRRHSCADLGSKIVIHAGIASDQGSGGGAASARRAGAGFGAMPANPPSPPSPALTGAGLGWRAAFAAGAGGGGGMAKGLSAGTLNGPSAATLSSGTAGAGCSERLASPARHCRISSNGPCDPSGGKTAASGSAFACRADNECCHRKTQNGHICFPGAPCAAQIH